MHKSSTETYMEYPVPVWNYTVRQKKLLYPASSAPVEGFSAMGALCYA